MHMVFFRILKLFFITGFLLQYLGIWYRTSGPLVNFTIFNTSNKNKAGDINSPWNLLVIFYFQVFVVRTCSALLFKASTRRPRCHFVFLYTALNIVIHLGVFFFVCLFVCFLFVCCCFFLFVCCCCFFLFCFFLGGGGAGGLPFCIYEVFWHISCNQQKLVFTN